MWSLLTKLLPAANATAGVVGVLALLAWIASNADKTVSFSYDQLAVIAGVTYAMLELNRRTPTT